MHYSFFKLPPQRERGAGGSVSAARAEESFGDGKTRKYNINDIHSRHGNFPRLEKSREKERAAVMI